MPSPYRNPRYFYGSQIFIRTYNYLVCHLIIHELVEGVFRVTFLRMNQLTGFALEILLF